MKKIVSFKENIVHIEFNGTRLMSVSLFFSQLLPKFLQQACFYLLYGCNIHIIGHSL